MSKIILISGPPRCGKTTLAKKLSEHLSISWMSTGVLGGIVRKYIPKEKDTELFPKNVIRKETGGGNDEMYSKYTPQEIADAYSKQAETVSEAIKTFVEFAEADGFDFILEGYYITPKVIKEIKEAGFDVEALILVNTNTEEIVDRCRNSDVDSDWVRDKTNNEETYSKIGEMVTLYSEKFIKEAEEFDFKYIDTGSDFSNKFKEAFNYLSK